MNTLNKNKMKKTKSILYFFFVSILALPACKKDKALQPQKEEIILTDFPNWEFHAPFIAKSETMLSDADYERTKNAIGVVEVRFKVGNKLDRLPVLVTTGDHNTTYYYKWEEKILKLYMQKNKAVIELPAKPGEVQLWFYVLK
jgi:hypothetical protein